MIQTSLQVQVIKIMTTFATFLQNSNLNDSIQQPKMIRAVVICIKLQRTKWLVRYACVYVRLNLNYYTTF